MHLHEYQTKEILQKYQLPIPPFTIVSNPQDIESKMHLLNINNGAVVKAQVLSGGRKKANGIRFTNDVKEIVEISQEMLHSTISNNQTGNRRISINKVMIAEKVNVKHEYYLGIVLNRKSKSAEVIASTLGGVDIENVAKNSPELILREPIHSRFNKLLNFQKVKICKFLGLYEKHFQKISTIIDALITAFFDTDATMLEINPLALTDDDNFSIVDAKCSIDDNAIFRQQNIANNRDTSHLSTTEAFAVTTGLNYVDIGGDIGCIVNGAGLAMATMDMIKDCGGSPANFFDVGGGSSEEKISQGFELILQTPSVKCIVINIFGGIIKCSTIASAAIQALKNHRNIPVIVRMEGTNIDEGVDIMKSSKLLVNFTKNLKEAAELACKLTKIRE